jgi:protein-S-isoprenylcysteine O-methyltransferase Ste14
MGLMTGMRLVSVRIGIDQKMTDSLRFWAIALGTVALVLLSRRCLFQPRTHGFYRFFAFESILLLLAINIQYWFADPLSGLQIASWILLFFSAFLAAHAFWLFHSVGQPSRSPAAGPDLPFEQTTRLVTIGAYRYIRHPMYASLLCLAWGIFLKHVTLSTTILVILASLALYVTARVEENENIKHFGQSYLQFIEKTKRFIPFLW